ncbi:hypothetical protein [Lactococcus garvieae]|uniref:hypothetical protein n=1 Tax=Lactococcus garvieae TaxID=1363 RepID=UPI00289192A7|nr:hypothetical protein [Lactococcus garvieae]MDT2741905.1 hypothetical protein [Lactococcus garvieae]
MMMQQITHKNSFLQHPIIYKGTQHATITLSKDIAGAKIVTSSGVFDIISSFIFMKYNRPS